MPKKPNNLINEKSPYLKQHAYNPVNWYAWNSETFQLAKTLDKPIFLSIGYSTCYWCHVMERECPVPGSNILKSTADGEAALVISIPHPAFTTSLV